MDALADASDAKAAAAQGRIEVSFHDVIELYDAMDPAPLERRDLDLDAEEYIVSWAREISRDARLHLHIILPQAQREKGPESYVPAAVAHFFGYRADMAGREFRELLRRGRLTLVIALPFLVLCTVLRALLHGMVEAGNLPYWLTHAEDGVMIMGWVAMWRPLELLLYDWWPVRGKRRIFERLAAMPVSIEYR